MAKSPYLLFCALLGAGGRAAAQTDSELASLLELLEEETSIATKNRLNADYVPGMVTVLHGRDLEARGLRTVWDALATVPGLDATFDETGTRQIISRGVGKLFGSGNVKLLLDDTTVNSTGYAQANMLLNMPVTQVERIEVGRGPGSALYGEFAYVGVINVITRRQAAEFSLGGGSADYRGGSAVISGGRAARGLRYSLNVAAWEAGVSGTDSGEDIFYGEGRATDSHAPAEVADAMEYRSALLELGYRDFELSIRHLQDGTGEHFGVNSKLPPAPRIGTYTRLDNWEARYDTQAGRRWRIALRLGQTASLRDRDAIYIGYADGVDALSYGHDIVYGDIRYRETWQYISAESHWKANPRHELLLGLETSGVSIDEAGWSFRTADYPLTTYAYEGATYPLGDTFLDIGKERRIASLTLQDEYRPSERITLTAGLRHDRYSDLDNSTTPRLAAVYRHDRNHIFKAQYAHAFRPSTFYESGYGDTAPETIDSYELGYIFRQHNRRLGVTAFYAELKDLVSFWEVNYYANMEKVRLSGIELEGEWKPHRAFSLGGNLSLLDGEETATGKPIYGSAETLANLSAGYSPAGRYLLKVDWRYVGERARQPLDDREPLEGYQRLDATLSLFRLFGHDLTGRIGVTNLLDEAIREPSPFTYSTYTPTLLASYPDDFPRAGRQWWLQLAYRF